MAYGNDFYDGDELLKDGNLSEGGRLKIVRDLEIGTYDDRRPCPHATQIWRDPDDGESQWVIPRVIIASANDDDYYASRVCLDCVLAALTHTFISYSSVIAP